MLTQYTIILTMLFISTIGTASAFYYKNRLETFTVQRDINNKSTIKLIHKINDLAIDIRIATYPTECDDLTKKIIGDDCDLGNYMEWAGPHLEQETKQLLILLDK